MPYADNSGVKIYWEEQGEDARGGQASHDPSSTTPGKQGFLRSQDSVLLIMGLGYTMDMWYRTVPVLSERYRTITFDNRGVGRSDVPPGPYSIAAMAADAAAVMDSAGVTRAHVFGISMGGMIALRVRPEIPSTNALADSGLHQSWRTGGRNRRCAGDHHADGEGNNVGGRWDSGDDSVYLQFINSARAS